MRRPISVKLKTFGEEPRQLCAESLLTQAPLMNQESWHGLCSYEAWKLETPDGVLLGPLYAASDYWREQTLKTSFSNRSGPHCRNGRWFDGLLAQT